jgi:hypothetical protein
MKVGDKRTFNFAKGEFEIKEIIEKTEMPYEQQWHICTCPNCKKEIISTKNYTLDKIEICEDAKGNRIMLGFTKEMIGDKPLTLRLPDKEFLPAKDMTAAVTEKSAYLKGVKNGD